VSLRSALIAILASLTILIYFLRQLEVMPYSPPYDMSALLGGSELALVRAAIYFLTALWCIILIALLLVWRGKRETNSN
jgi:hypothetical protein